MIKKPIFKHEDVIDGNSILHNFDVSVVMPFYRKLDEMKQVLPVNAPFFQRNGIEVVLVMDEDTQQEGVLSLIQEYPFINWRVVVNHLPHEWRNPVKAINVGIRYATKKYLMVCSPESEFYTDAIYLLRNTLKEYPDHFVIGTVAFILCGEDDSDFYSYMPYGSIMAEKEHFIAIGGYDESLRRWGGDDDNIRARLEMLGIKKLILPEVKLHHRERDREGKEKRKEKHALIPVEEEIEIYYPNRYKVNDEQWGRDFCDVTYDWQNNLYAKTMLEKYLNRFEANYLSYPCASSQKYSRIVLAQSYNESEIILDFLENMARYFDGIILLDDGSTDDTYEKAVHPKLLLKVKKKRTGFIDIENRNILLDLASFFSSEWFCFMDTDERFDERFVDFDSATSNDHADILFFGTVNLWNSPSTYNAEYPFSRRGIMSKLRMFRNIGHCQIHTDKKRVHFSLMPYQKNLVPCNVLYWHYGMITKSLREEKYGFYEREDVANDQKSYEHMLKHEAELLDIEGIRCRNGIFYNVHDLIPHL
jgi:glycosyltransferase involved in cell wall biosynthesis